MKKSWSTLDSPNDNEEQGQHLHIPKLGHYYNVIYLLCPLIWNKKETNLLNIPASVLPKLAVSSITKDISPSNESAVIDIESLTAGESSDAGDGFFCRFFVVLGDRCNDNSILYKRNVSLI